MNILETFLILFESDSAEVKKGADDAKKSTDGLEDSITSADKASQKLGQSFLAMATQAITSIAALMSVGAIAKGVFIAADYADRLDEASEALGESVENIDAWGGAVTISGGSTDSFIGSIKSLSANMAQMDTTGKSRVAPFFKELGISMLDAAGKARPIMELLPEIAGAFEGMNKQQAIGFGRKLGLDDGTIMLLQKGRREVDALIARQKELGTVRAEDAQAAAQYYDALDDTARVFRSLFSIIAGDVLPVLTWLLEGLQDIGIWMRNHEGFIYGFLSTLIVLMTTLGVRAGLAVIPLLALAWPFIAVAAGVTALSVAMGLLWDDFMKFKEGGQSLIPWEDILGGFMALKDGVFAIWDSIVEYIEGSIEGILRAISAIKNFFTAGTDSYKEARRRMSPAAAAQDELLGQAKGQINLASSTPIAAQSSQSIMSSRNLNQSNSVAIGEVNIQTQATDADGISNEIGRSLKGQMNQVISNYDDGVRG